MTEPSVACPVAGTCPGCGLIGSPYADQLDAKRRQVTGYLARYPELASLAVEPTRPAPRVAGYRSRAKFACQRHGGRLALGLYRPGTHVVTDVGTCPVLHPRLATLAAAVRELCDRPPFDALALSYVSLRYSAHQDRSHLSLVLRHDEPPLAQAAAEALMASVDVLAGVSLNLNPGPPLRVFGPRFERLVGDESLIERIGDRDFELSPGAFFQANLDQAAAIIDLGREELGITGGSLVDFYSGAGVLGMTLAQPTATVTLVEGYDRAANDARRSAMRNGFSAVRVVAASAEKAAMALAAELGHADRVVVNPPRKGCSADVLAAMAALTPARALYVSCDPATLVRDLAILARLGLTATRIVPFDMLPQTDHVEVVAVLQPASGTGRSPAVDVLYQDRDLLVVDKPPLMPLAALAAHHGPAGACRAALELDRDASGAVILATNPEVGRRLDAARARGEVSESYLVLVRGRTRDNGVIGSGGIRYSRLQVVHGHSLLAVTATTRTSAAVRLHMARIGHPVIGDPEHGDHPTNRHFVEKYAVGRPMLHVAAITFLHPRGGQRHTVASLLPGDFGTVLERLGLDSQTALASAPTAATDLAILHTGLD